MLFNGILIALLLTMMNNRFEAINKRFDDFTASKRFSMLASNTSKKSATRRSPSP
jgi:hypothetical protein